MISFLNGSPVPQERIDHVFKRGPRSPAFYLDLQDWKEDRNIWEQVQAELEKRGIKPPQNFAEAVALNTKLSDILKEL